MEINNLRNLIVRAWAEAEAQLRQDLKLRFPDCDEEFITGLLSGYLRSEFETVSGNGCVEQAFLSDLATDFPEVDFYNEHQIWRGLIAAVTFHPRNVEAKTGGDFGLVVVRPEVSRELEGLRIEDGRKRGLLCQAKISQRPTKSRRKGKLGKLSDNEVKVLEAKLDYLALVLYKYQDIDRKMLAPFKWQMASGATVKDIRNWLAKDCLPNEWDSPQALAALVDERIGTGDERLIKKDIAPQVRSSLIITIKWKDGWNPGDVIHFLQQEVSAQPEVEVFVK